MAMKNVKLRKQRQEKNNNKKTHTKQKQINASNSSHKWVTRKEWNHLNYIAQYTTACVHSMSNGSAHTYCGLLSYIRLRDCVTFLNQIEIYKSIYVCTECMIFLASFCNIFKFKRNANVIIHNLWYPWCLSAMSDTHTWPKRNHKKNFCFFFSRVFVVNVVFVAVAIMQIEWLVYRYQTTPVIYSFTKPQFFSTDYFKWIFFITQFFDSLQLKICSQFTAAIQSICVFFLLVYKFNMHKFLFLFWEQQQYKNNHMLVTTTYENRWNSRLEHNKHNERITVK